MFFHPYFCTDQTAPGWLFPGVYGVLHPLPPQKKSPEYLYGNHKLCFSWGFGEGEAFAAKKKYAGGVVLYDQ